MLTFLSLPITAFTQTLIEHKFLFSICVQSYLVSTEANYNLPYKTEACSNHHVKQIHKLLKGRFFRCFFQKSTYHQNGLNVFKYTVMYMFFFSDKVWYENYFSLSPAFMFKCFTTSTVVTTICRYITQSLFYKYFDARVHKHFCYNQSDSHVSFIFS